MTTDTEIQIDAEALEKTGWLILDAAEYKREMDENDTAPAAQRLRKEAKRRIVQRARKLAKSGDPLDIAETVQDMVKQFGKS